LQQQLDQTGFVGFIQTRQPSRSPSPPQSNVAAFLMFLPPPADGLVTHLQTATDFAVIKALCKQFHSFEPTLLQSHEVAPNASRIAHVGLDTAKSIGSAILCEIQ
jgi:hypothetical protein